MDVANFIKQGLYFHGYPIYETDIPYIQQLITTINLAQTSTNVFPHLNEEVPITIVDKGMIL